MKSPQSKSSERQLTPGSTMPQDEAGRQQMIAIAAYYRAERRGFDGGDPVEDWLEAEQEIDSLLRVAHNSAKPAAKPSRRHTAA